MGQTQGTSAVKQFSHNALKRFQANYAFHCEKNDERWGVVQVWKEKASNRYVMIMSKSFHSDPEFREYGEVLRARSSLEHPVLVELVGWSNEDADGLCGHNRRYNLYVEYLSQNLEKEIHRRSHGKEYFEEAELWYLGKTVVSFCEFLQNQGISHGDIRPHQILLTQGENEEGQIKLADNGLIGQFQNAFNLTLSEAGRGYLSPHVIHAHGRKDLRPEYDVYKADVYSLGMTLLYAATLRDPHKHYYDWITKEVNSNAVEKGLREIEERYSIQLAKYIASMLDEDEFTRPDFIRLTIGFPVDHVQISAFPHVHTVLPPPPPPPQLIQSQIKPQAFTIQQPLVQSSVTLQQPLVQNPVTFQQPLVHNSSYLKTSHVAQPPLLQSGLRYSQAPIIQTAIQPPIQPPIQTVQYISQPPTYIQQPPLIQTSGFLPAARYTGGISYVSQTSPQKRFENVEDLSELDRRVQEAIRTTEETINRNSQIPNLGETVAVGEQQDQEQPDVRE